VWVAPAGIAVTGWAAIAVMTVFHFVVDEWRVWTIQRLNSPDTFLFFLLDQFIHLLLIFLFSPLLPASVPETWVVLAILLVLTTHFTSIFVYFLEKDLFGFARLHGREKYFSMAERLATALSLLLPGLWAFSFLAVWLLGMVMRRRRQDPDFSWLNIILGNVLAVIFGLIGRSIYYR
jgi:hypothetical protein